MYKSKCVRENRGREEKERLRAGWKDGEIIGEERRREWRARKDRAGQNRGGHEREGQRLTRGSLEASDCVTQCVDVKTGVQTT